MECGLRVVDSNRTSAGHAENRAHSRWPDCTKSRKRHPHHRRTVALQGPALASRSGRHPHRHRHGPRRRSAHDRPHRRRRRSVVGMDGEPRRRRLLRAIVDSRLRLPLGSEIVKSAQNDVVVFTTQSTDSPRARALQRELSDKTPQATPDATLVYRRCSYVRRLEERCHNLRGCLRANVGEKRLSVAQRAALAESRGGEHCSREDQYRQSHRLSLRRTSRERGYAAR